MVVIPTDKSGKLKLMTKDTYREAAKEHIDKDEEVEWKQVKKTEDTANRIAKSMGRILRMGQARNQIYGMMKALITKDSAPPKVNFFIKDHKQTKEGRRCPPTRPVCSAVEGPISRLQELVILL